MAYCYQALSRARPTMKALGASLTLGIRTILLRYTVDKCAFSHAKILTDFLQLFSFLLIEVSFTLGHQIHIATTPWLANVHPLN